MHNPVSYATSYTGRVTYLPTEIDPENRRTFGRHYYVSTLNFDLCTYIHFLGETVVGYTRA